MQQFATEERPLGDLFADLTADLRTLVRQEMALARAEISDKVSHLGRDTAMMVAGALLLFVGFQALVATAIIALAYVLPWWLSALIVTAVLLLVGGLIAWRGYQDFKNRGVVPQQTVASLKEDAQWAKEQLK
ncbi:MAG: phage holin family protein [Chloroflexi bacterium]|nr:phage holin family protein [Chloroflexota bacterium]